MPGRTNALYEIAERALSRAVAAPLIHGNDVRLLKDAAENYPAWINAIRRAEKWIHFESYIIHEDDVGRQFADLLAAKAREGVKVRVLYDWVGSLGNASRRFWSRLAKAGIDVRCFNAPRLDSPFGWTSRDHRKMIGIDGRVAFVSGLCVGKRWSGFPERGIAPWRDTGVEIRGPAVVDVEQGFAAIWADTGNPLPAAEIPAVETVGAAGDVAVRIVGSVPNAGRIYRLDQLLAALAQKSIWLSDAYLVGTASYVQALRSAALGGVDVRLLIPRAYDIPGVRALSRAGLRPLLETGVRIFEWNGPMMHAKSAVIDGRWSRVGSTNLNLFSWIANWELDVVVEDNRFAREMEEMFLNDLAHSTEIVLSEAHRIRRPRPVTKPARLKRGRPVASQTAADVMRLSHTVGAAISNRRELGPAEAVIMIWAAVFLTAFSAAALYWPRGVIVPVVTLCLWVSATLVLRAWKLRSTARRARRARTEPRTRKAA